MSRGAIALGSAAAATSAWCAVSSAFVAPTLRQSSGSDQGRHAQDVSTRISAAESVSPAAVALGAVGAALGGAAARAAASNVRPAQAATRTLTVSPLRAFENELGVQSPVGFWDPVGFTADGDVQSFRRRRSVELKHGRVSMLACMGYITPEVTGKFPGYLSPSMNLKFADIPNGIAAISKVPVLGWAQILAYGYFVEYKSGFNSDWQSGTPGDFGWKVLTSSDPLEKTKKLQRELANGRLAMTAIMAMIFQNGTIGNTGPEMWLGRNFAFENELGVQAPFGFWDPAGFTSDGDTFEYKRRRIVEVKHGRVAMLACLGYIVPEYYKFPGVVSTSVGIKFADIPNGLAALPVVPALGWTQIVGFCGYMEIFGANQRSDEEAGNLRPRLVFALTEVKNEAFQSYEFNAFGIPNGPKITDPLARKKKLAAEIANGRLAMMAIIGMFFQDGLTGSAWGDWANFTASPLRAFENETGVQPPVGFWDPVGFCKSSTTFDFNRRREVELKHGRISMFATIGYIVPEYTRLPGDCSPSYGIKFVDIPNGFAAISKVPALGWAQIFGLIGFVETILYNEQKNGEPGNYGAGFLGLRSLGVMADIKNEETRKKKLNAELANGRLAMMAIIGMFFQDGLTGSAWGDWALYTASPLRAFENELGVQAPVGFWDPVGFTADGSSEAFARRRQTELKHGRISMLATMGYITPEITGKFPGYLSPSMGLKFADIPNGLSAISKVPAAGWAQILAYMAYCEVSQDQSAGTPAASGDFGWKVLTSDDPAEKTKKLSAEIANGRLAMMAIIGMFFQDGLTGSAWGDWALYTASPLRAFENELGVQAPLGFWDPMGFSKDGDIDDFTRRRESEIKNGRVAMFATMGYIAPEYFKFPGVLAITGNLKFADVPNGLAALKVVPLEGWLQWLALCGCYEIGVNGESKPGEPGNYGKGQLGITGQSIEDPEKRKRSLNSEIANGRLAMMAIIGMFFQDGLTGSAWGDWALYTASPLRAFENELGVQAPIGFWDPLGFTASGDAASFRRRRCVELKHGRVSMLAAIGYIVPEYFKFPGYLAPSMSLKFAEVPNGLAALSKVPLAGWAQIVSLAGGVELFAFTDDPSRAPGDFENASPFGIPKKGATPGIANPEVRKKKLSAEIANGRLAMMAIIGMFYQDGLTGSAWGDWALYTASPLR